MKTTNYLAVSLATLAFYSGGSALAQGTYEHKLTVSLVLAEQIDNPDRESNNGISYSSFIYNQKITNRNLLEIFVGEGEIPEIYGWSIVAISQDGEIQGFALTKRGYFPVDVSDYFDLGTESNASYSFKGYDDFNNGTYSDNYTSQALGYLDFRTLDDSLELYLDAFVRYHGSFFEDYVLPYESDRLYSASIDRGIGALYDFDELDEFIGHLDGSYKVGNGILTNIVLFD